MVTEQQHNKDFPGCPVVKTALPIQGAWVQSLVRKLGFHMPRGVAKNKLKEFYNKK